MKSSHFRILSIFAFTILLVFFIYSCKKDPYQVGINLLPPSDTLNVKTSDTASFVAYTILQDTIRTDETSLSILGSLMDPVFGSTTANFYMQYWLSEEAPIFGTNPVFDSVILMIPYGTIYGDTNAILNFKVYEMSEDIHYDSSYYSNHTVKTYGIPLADYSFRPAPNDSLIIGGGTKRNFPPHIRINLNKLTNYFGNKLLHAPAATLGKNANFIEFMKGLYIESSVAHSGGALLSFDPTSSLSDIVLYYHNEGDTSHPYFSFVGAALSARFNHFDHNHYLNAVPELRQQIFQHDTTLGKNNLFIQGLGGVRIRLRLPFLKNFVKSGKIAVNSAVLTFNNAETDTTLKPPVKLTLVIVDSANRVGFLVDENEGTSYFGGTYNTYARSYKFRITQQMQRIIDGKIKNYDMYLMANDPTSNVLVPNRVILTGTKPQLPAFSEDRIKLQVIYTRLH